MKLYNKPTSILLLFLSSIIPFLWYFKEHRLLLWDISWYAVFLLMIVRPLSDLFPAQKWIKKLIPYRKELGILSASVVVSNALYSYVPMGGRFFSHYFSFQFWDLRSPYTYGHIAELVAFPLLITSNRYSMKKLKGWWKRIQRTSYLYYYGAAILLISFGKTDVLIISIFTAIIGLLAALKRRRIWFM